MCASETLENPSLRLWSAEKDKFTFLRRCASPVPLGLPPENLVQAEERLFAASEITAGLRLDRNSGLNKSKP